MENKERKGKTILIICNIVLIAITLISTILYSQYIYKSQKKAKEESFIKTIESMKQVSQNHLDSEKGYVRNWASYISEREMTMEEALDFLRSINTDEERFAHIVDMTSFEAYSAYYPKGEEKIDTYLQYKKQNTDDDEAFENIMRTIMQSMFDGRSDALEVLGKYRLQETQSMAVGIGSKVTLKTDCGKKDYLLLRIIPVEAVKKTWVFPTEYTSAEVGIITRAGDYVIQSASMKSQNFIEYIRAYNYQNDYNKVEKLREVLQSTESGVFEYKNFRNDDCLWYYSSFGQNSALDILGVLNVDNLKISVDAWYIILIVCSILIVLSVIDGVYLLSINHKLREAVKLSEQASRAKTQFLSAMSHDIRTPLNAVLGMMTIAQKKASDPQAVTDCMDKGIHSGKQLLTLINDVLDISKIESGEVTLNNDKVSLIELTQNMTDMLEPDIAQKDIQLTCDFKNLPYKYVYADKMRLSQIYTNLLTNAVKYTEIGGKISVRLYEENISDQGSYTRLVFCVEDTGIGMTEEFQKHMYSRFSREINTQVNNIQGTGLGLSIVKQIVDLMQGTIDCQSEPGVGTSFTVRIVLPIVEDCEEDDSNNRTSQDIEQLHLLVAEDNALNWEIFSELISEYDIECDHAQNGKACVDMLIKAPAGTYDAILMDVHMPEMNGYEATKTIRALSDENLNKIPIIAMTADAFAEDVQMCLNCGMNGHIAKPIDMNKLLIYLQKIKNRTL